MSFVQARLDDPGNLGLGEERENGPARGPGVQRIEASEFHRHLDLLRALELVDIGPPVNGQKRQRRGLLRFVPQPKQRIARDLSKVELSKRAGSECCGARAQAVLARVRVNGDEVARRQRLQDAVDHGLAQSQLSRNGRDSNRALVSRQAQQYVCDPFGRRRSRRYALQGLGSTDHFTLPTPRLAVRSASATREHIRDPPVQVKRPVVISASPRREQRCDSVRWSRPRTRHR